MLALEEASELNRGHKEAMADVASHPAQEGNITLKQLSIEYQKEFLAARQTVANRLLSARAVRILNDAESRRFEEQHPEFGLDSLWTETWKATDEQ